MEEIKELPTVIEIVISFVGGAFIVVSVSSNECRNIVDFIRHEVDKFLETKIAKYVRLNHLTGFADFRADLIAGVYTRPAHVDTTKAFQEKVLHLQERAVKAVEDIGGEGEQWKKES